MQWSTCSETCGPGKQTRTRECYRSSYNRPCEGKDEEMRTCSRETCKSSGNPYTSGPSKPVWGSWGSWSSCSKTCNSGEKVRQRVCMNGKKCPGNNKDSNTCNEQTCTNNNAYGATVNSANTLANLFSFISQKLGDFGDEDFGEIGEVFRTDSEDGAERSNERCVAVDVPKAPATCTHADMVMNIEVEIQTLMKAFLTASYSTYDMNALDSAFKRLINAHNKFGYEQLPCKLQESIYYKVNYLVKSLIVNKYY